MKRKISVSTLLSLIILIGVICISSNKVLNKQIETTNVSNINITERNQTSEDNEMKGLWVSYISLDMQEHTKDAEAFADKFSDIINEAESLNLNTLIVQVRPFCDALYYSELFPHSHILSGEQGVSPGYDALEYMCKTAHDNGLRIEAWVNPLRVKTGTSTFSLSENNPYVINNEIALKTESGIYLNPANSDARELIINGVKEITENYSVDGIQFDDYFYPEDIDNEDEYCYKEYLQSVNQSNTPLTLDEWRKNNINLLISETYLAIKSVNPNVQFGISPQGNINNNNSIYADVKSWCNIEGYVDYICPQIYYSLTSPALNFETALNDWKNLEYHSKIKVYIGLAAYKAGSDEDEGTWHESNKILKDELTLIRKYGFDGFILYEYRSLKNESAMEEIENLRNAV